MVEIPELGIKDSKLAEKVIKILQSTDDKFELAHKMVEIADEHIRNQTNRDTVDIAIEMARRPDLELSEGDWRKVRRLLESAKNELRELSEREPSVRRLFGKVDWILTQLPCPLKDMVFGKLSGHPAPDRPLTPYSLIVGVRACLREIDEIQSITSCENQANKTGQGGLNRILGRIHRTLTKVLEITEGKPSPLNRTW
jgi:hypothetical protein